MNVSPFGVSGGDLRCSEPILSNDSDVVIAPAFFNQSSVTSAASDLSLVPDDQDALALWSQQSSRLVGDNSILTQSISSTIEEEVSKSIDALRKMAGLRFKQLRQGHVDHFGQLIHSLKHYLSNDNDFYQVHHAWIESTLKFVEDSFFNRAKKLKRRWDMRTPEYTEVLQSELMGALQFVRGVQTRMPDGKMSPDWRRVQSKLESLAQVVGVEVRPSLNVFSPSEHFRNRKTPFDQLMAYMEVDPNARMPHGRRRVNIDFFLDEIDRLFPALGSLVGVTKREFQQAFTLRAQQQIGTNRTFWKHFRELYDSLDNQNIRPEYDLPRFEIDRFHLMSLLVHAISADEVLYFAKTLQRLKPKFANLGLFISGVAHEYHRYFYHSEHTFGHLCELRVVDAFDQIDGVSLLKVGTKIKKNGAKQEIDALLEIQTKEELFHVYVEIKSGRGEILPDQLQSYHQVSGNGPRSVVLMVSRRGQREISSGIIHKKGMPVGYLDLSALKRLTAEDLIEIFHDFKSARLKVSSDIAA